LLRILCYLAHFVHIFRHVFLDLGVLITEAVDKFSLSLFQHIETGLAHICDLLVQGGLDFSYVPVRIVELVLEFFFVIVDPVSCVDPKQGKFRFQVAKR
jgi:hypothetical protein